MSPGVGFSKVDFEVEQLASCLCLSFFKYFFSCSVLLLYVLLLLSQNSDLAFYLRLNKVPMDQ